MFEHNKSKMKQRYETESKKKIAMKKMDKKS